MSPCELAYAPVNSSARVNPFASVVTTSDDNKRVEKRVSNESQNRVSERSAVVSINVKPEDYFAFQLSCVKDIKAAFVYREQDVFYINVAVDKRDLSLNRRIFDQLRAIMQFYRQYKFDLSVIPLNGRNVSDLALRGQQVLP